MALNLDILNINKKSNNTILYVGEAKEKIRILIDVLRNSDTPGLFLWGPPGIGKSAIIKEIAEEENLNFIDLRLSLLDPIDLRGLPMIDYSSNQAKWLPPDFLPSEDMDPGILFLDELNAATPVVQASAYQLILDKHVGNYKLPKDWVIIAAGNRESDKAVTFTMPTPLSNRFLHLDLECNIHDWKKWAYSAGIHESIISFLTYKPEYLFQFNPESETRAFATPRSWAFLSKIIEKTECKDNLIYFASGLIGYAVATEFIAFFKLYDQIPEIQPILEGKSDEIPKNLSVLYLLIGGIISQYQHNPDKKYKKNLISYMKKLPVEFGVFLARDLIQIDNSFALEKDFIDWANENRESLFTLN
ncbi:MAG: ATP-binding protein [Promethearchaeota archaeon]